MLRHVHQWMLIYVLKTTQFEGLGKNYRNSILSTFSTTQKLIYFFRMISGKSEFGIYAG